MLQSSKQHSQATRTAQAMLCDRAASIYLEGDAATAWFAVAEGVVRTCRYSHDGTRQITGFHFPGDVFGLSQGVRPDTAEAVTSVTVWSIPHGETGSQEAADWYGRGLRKALTSAQSTIARLGRRTSHERVAAFILMIAERKGTPDSVELPMSRTDIADYLGLTMHTVSRSMSYLCDLGLIALSGPNNIGVRDLSRLRSLAGEEAGECAPLPIHSGADIVAAA